jgi:Domain of unknown function (DUF4405)
MKRKNIISLSVAFAFLSLSITGILLYIKQKAHAVEITHTIFGLIFVGFAVFHIINNWSSITGYSKEKKSGKFQKEFIIAAGVFGIVLIGGVTEFLEPVAEAGSFLAPKRPPRPEKLEFNEVKTNENVAGRGVRILIEKSKDTELPVMAIWVEDENHKFVENLFVPGQEAKMPESEEEAREGHFEKVPFSEKSLPTWAAKASSKTALLKEETPKDNFVLNTKTSASGNVYIMAEIKSKYVNEVYSAQISAANGGVSKLSVANGKLLKSGIVEVF